MDKRSNKPAFHHALDDRPRHGHVFNPESPGIGSVSVTASTSSDDYPQSDYQQSDYQQANSQPGELLVRFAGDMTATARLAAIGRVLDTVDGHISEAFMGRPHGPGETLVSQQDPLLVRISVGKGWDLDAAATLLSQLPGVEAVEHNWIYTTQEISNDSYFTSGSLWGMYGDKTAPLNIYGSQAAEAWANGDVGATSMAIGVVDTGIDYTHPDLYLNIWLNQGEIPLALRGLLVDMDGDGLIGFRDLNGVTNASHVADLNANGRIDGGDLLNDFRWENLYDEDGNGYFDDLIGWDFVENDNDPSDSGYHGTHVAGTIAGLGGNGSGVAGVAWEAALVALKFLATDGGTTANAVKALNYFTWQAGSAANAAYEFVATNNSWGGGGYSSSLHNAIIAGAQQGIFFVAAAGNDGSNNDAVTRYPGNYSTQAYAGFEAVVAVAAISSTGALASWSNYGAATVDLGAPGVSIWSTVPGGYGSLSGTSMATPHVTGAIALYAAANPDATASETRDALLGTTLFTTSLDNKTFTEGRLDISTLLLDPPAHLPITNTAVIASAEGETLMSATGAPSGSVVLAGSLAATLAAGEVLSIYRSDTLVGTANVDGNSWSFADSVALTKAYSYKVQVTSASGQGPLSDSASVERYWFYGAKTSDTVTGNSLDNLVSGVPSAGSSPGKGTIDSLFGGAGADLFLLGDSRGRFYDDGRSTNAGTSDYGRIRDFNINEDSIQLDGTAGQYLFRAATLSGFSGLGIYYDTNGSTLWDSRDELVGHVIGVNSAADVEFSYV